MDSKQFFCGAGRHKSDTSDIIEYKKRDPEKRNAVENDIVIFAVFVYHKFLQGEGFEIF